jgi:hypothetical protein
VSLFGLADACAVIACAGPDRWEWSVPAGPHVVTNAALGVARAPRRFLVVRDGQVLASGAYVAEDGGTVLWPADSSHCVVFPTLAHVEPFFAAGGLVTLEVIP